MAIDEILDDEALNPKELFDEKKFITLLINRDGYSKKQNETADFIDRLLEKEINREEQEEIFKNIKATNAGEMLIESIRNTRSKTDKAKLLAAIWESGVDVSRHFIYLTELACENDFLTAMEALTIIQNMEEKIEEKTLASAVQIAQDCKSQNKELIEDLINCIKEKAE